MRNRVGMIVPSSNTTMETELPELLARVDGARFTFHSSRVRMRDVTPEQLRGMVAETDRAATELADAPCDVVTFACLVAVMAQGPGYHTVAEERIRAVLAAQESTATVVSSAGALIAGIKQLGARRVALVTPYVRSLTDAVIAYLAAEGIEVTDSVSLEVSDNCAVGALPPERIVAAYRELELGGAEALVLSACVQMPSLEVVQEVEDECGLPVLTAATATAAGVLRALGITASVPKAGALLA